MAQHYKLRTSWGQFALLAFVIWLMFFIPFLGHMATGKGVEQAFYSLKYVTPLYFLWIGTFCLNYFWLVPRYFLRKKYSTSFFFRKDKIRGFRRKAPVIR